MDDQTGIIVYKGDEVFTVDPRPAAGDAEIYTAHGFKVFQISPSEAARIQIALNNGRSKFKWRSLMPASADRGTRHRAHLAHLDTIYPIRLGRHA